MDIKPSNVVIDDSGNAVLIDISGIGGVTHEWRAPEIRDEISPIELPFETRRLNDIWAYGKLLAEIASNAGDSPFAGTLKWAAGHFTEDVHNRWTLSEGISRLVCLF
jgi:serine/threonine protein kinase